MQGRGNKKTSQVAGNSMVDVWGNVQQPNFPRTQKGKELVKEESGDMAVLEGIVWHSFIV